MKRLDAFFETITESELARCYAFFGEEDFLKGEAEELLAERIRRELSGTAPDRIVFQGREHGPADVEATCSYSSLFGGLRFVVLDEYEQWSSKDRKRFASYLAETGVSPGTVLLVKTTERKFPVTVPRLVSHVFWKPFARDLLRWAERRLRKGGVSFDNEVARLMVDRYAGEDVKSMRMLASEIDKLVLFMGHKGAVTVDTVRKVCSAPPQAEWFRFLEAVSNRRAKEALALARTFHETDPAGAVGFLSVLSGRMADLLVLRCAGSRCPQQWRELGGLCRHRQTPRLSRAERGSLDKQIGQLRKEMAELVEEDLAAGVKKPSPWAFAGRCLEAEGFTLDELFAAVKLCAEVECRLKSGESEPLAELDILLTRLCVPGLLVADLY